MDSPFKKKKDPSATKTDSPSQKKKDLQSVEQVVEEVVEKKIKPAVEEERKIRAEKAKNIPLRLPDPPDFKDVGIDVVFTPYVYIAVGFILTYLLGYYGFGLFWAGGIFALCYHVNNLFIKRLVLKKLKTQGDLHRFNNYPEKETVDWINQIFYKVWRNYPKTIEAELLKNVNPILAEKKPGMINEVSIASFDIGKNPPILSNFRIPRELNKDQEFVFDMDFHWDSDFDLRIIAVKGVTMPVKIANLVFHAKVRVFARLLPDKHPFVSYFYVQFHEEPYLDISISSVGEIGIPGLITVIQSKIGTVLQDIMVAPKFFPVNIAEKMGVTVAPEDMLPKEEIKVDKSLGGALGSGIGAIGSGLGAGVGAIGSGVGAVGSGVGAGVGALGTGVGAVGSGVGAGVTSGVGLVGDGCGAVGSGVGKGVGAVGSGVASIGSGMGKGLGSGLSALGMKKKEAKKEVSSESVDESPNPIVSSAEEKDTVPAESVLPQAPAPATGESDDDLSHLTETVADKVEQALDGGAAPEGTQPNPIKKRNSFNFFHKKKP